MKSIKGIFSVLVAAIIALSSVTVFAESTTYELDELHMKISVPNEMLGVTRESKKTDSFFSKFDLDYEDTMNSFESNNIYFQAIKQDASLTLTVTMSTDKNSKKLENYARIKDSDLKAIMAKYLNDDAYKSGNLVECNNLKYIYLTMKTKSGKKTIQAQQYCTVVNGMNIVITLDAPAGKKLKSSHSEMFTEVINNTFISDDNFFEKYKNIIFYGGITFFGLVVVAIVLFFLLKKLRNPNRKHKHLVHELAHEHRISETTQIPRKKSIQNLTKPTMSFMKNYKPIDEQVKKEDKAETIPEEDIENISEPEQKSEAVEKPFEVKAKPVTKKPKREVPLAEKIVSDKSKKVSEPVDDVPIAQPMEFTEKKEKPTRNIERDFDFEDEPEIEVKEEAETEVNVEPENEIEIVDTADDSTSENVDAYFEEVPEEKDMYAYSDVDTAVDEYSAAKEESNLIREERRETAETVLRILKAIGRGILYVFQGFWMVLCFIVIHIKYFCVNVYRAVKKSRAKKKRMKIEEQRRRNVSEQRRRQREAELARRRLNANRNEGDLVKVRSSEERRPVRRSTNSGNRRPQQRPQSGRNPQRQRPPQNRRPQQINGQPSKHRPRNRY